MPPGSKPSTGQGHANAGLVVSSTTELAQLANIVYSAGAPKGINKPEQLAVIIAYGLEIGLKPMQSVASIMLVNGKPSIYGEAGLALLRSSPLLETLDHGVEGEGDKRSGWIKTKRKNDPTIRETRYTVADAQRAGIWGKAGPWTTNPERMLRWRAIGFHAKDYWSDVLCGLAIYGSSDEDFAAPEAGVSVQVDVKAPATSPPINALPAAGSPPSTNGTHAPTPRPGPITESQKQQFGKYKLDFLRTLSINTADPAAVATAWGQFIGLWGCKSALEMTAAQADEALAKIYDACHPKEAREVFSGAGQS